jgi:hypothetical protein
MSRSHQVPRAGSHKSVPPAGDLYPGVPLYTFLDPTNINSANQLVVLQATDGLEVVVALAGRDPAFGGSLNDLLPYADTGGNFRPMAWRERSFPPTPPTAAGYQILTPRT